MKVLLTTAYDTPWSCTEDFAEAILADRYGVHRLTDAAEGADVILFADARHDLNDWRLRKIRGHPLVKRFPAKCVVYCIMDQPWCGLAGIYTCMPRSSFDYARQRACAYAKLPNDLLSTCPTGRAALTPRLLFSFAGRNCNPVRSRVLALRHERGEVIDTSTHDFFGGGAADLTAAKVRYADLLNDSRFVLCPRGAGTSSFRIFEALAAARVPVIISDEWVPVEGPDWHSFSLRVAEADVEAVPDMLARAEARFDEMSRRARHAWDEHFAPDVIWHRMMELCAALVMPGRVPLQTVPSTLNARFLRLWGREQKARLRAASRRLSQLCVQTVVHD